MALILSAKGQFLLDIEKISEDELTELALENDAEDVLVEHDHYEVICETADFDKLAEALKKEGLSPIHLNLLTFPVHLFQ